jgi:uncharacterized membrane protein YkvA (DUF1232 family)
MARKSKAVADADFDPGETFDPSTALVPAVVRVNEIRVRRGFWPKLTRVAGKIPFAKDLLSLWFCARDPNTPAAAKGMILAGLAYFVLPVDVIPDVIAGLGFTDDAAVIAALISLVSANIKPEHRAAAGEALERLKNR